MGNGLFLGRAAGVELDGVRREPSRQRDAFEPPTNWAEWVGDDGADSFLRYFSEQLFLGKQHQPRQWHDVVYQWLTQDDATSEGLESRL